MDMTAQTCPAYAYEPNQRELTLEQGEIRTSYGISCLQINARGVRHTTQALYDISLREDTIRLMAELFTLSELPPDRFKSVVINLIP